MENLAKLHKEKKITKMDIVIYEHLSTFSNITASQINNYWGFDYSQTTISLKRLLENDLILKSNENPARYYLK